MVLGLMLWAVMSGCQQNGTAKELAKQSPFHIKKPVKEILIITCDWIPVELPGSVDVTELFFWKGDSTAVTDPNDPNGTGTKKDSKREPSIWERNGMQFALLKERRWGDIHKELQEAGGEFLPKITYLIRNRYDVADYLTYPVEDTKSLFLLTRQGRLRGMTLMEGDCGFRVNCVPKAEAEEPNVFQVKFVPIFKHGEATEKYVRRGEGRIRRESETPMVFFEDLTWQGEMQKGELLCLAVRQSLRGSKTLGNLFFTQREGTADRQMVLFFAPLMQTRLEMKRELLRQRK
jgi:hypothetical protein